MVDNIQVSILEKLVINCCSPFIAVNEGIPFRTVVDVKIKDYKRLVKHVQDDGKIPSRVQIPYHITPCGNLAVGMAYARKYWM
jgi:hypothetical protein